MRDYVTNRKLITRVVLIIYFGVFYDRHLHKNEPKTNKSARVLNDLASKDLNITV